MSRTTDDDDWDPDRPDPDEERRRWEASNSMFTSFCDGAEYGLNLTHHELVWVAEKLLRRRRDPKAVAIAAKLKPLLDLSTPEHRRHEERGTCIEEMGGRHGRGGE